jgi:hypothetical protein
MKDGFVPNEGPPCGFIESPAEDGAWRVRFYDPQGWPASWGLLTACFFSPDDAELLTPGAILRWQGALLRVVTEPRWTAERQAEAEAWAARMARLVEP